MNFGWLDRFIPERYRDGSEEHRRARVLVGVTILLGLLALLFAWQARSGPTPQILQSNILFLLACLVLANIGLLHLGLPTVSAATWLCIEIVIALGVVSLNGVGIKDVALRWLILMPLIGGVLVSPRFGFGIATLAFGVLLGLFYLGQTPGYFRELGPSFQWFELIVSSSVCFGTAVCAELFEGGRRRAMERLERTLDELRAAHSEAEAMRLHEAMAKDQAVASAELKGELATRMLENVRELSTGIAETRDRMSRMTQGTRAIGDTVAGFSAVAKESSRTAEEVDRLDVQSQAAIDEISGALHQTSTSIEQMRMTLREVAKNVESLLKNADSASASMSELDASVQQVEKNARGGAELSANVMRDAERGRSAVSASKRGIDTIRDNTRVGAKAVRALGARVADINSMLDVINQVADRTNLLALNASIIAAQAGDAGRGFAVVANEIKGLADETQGSIKRIDGIVKNLEGESGAALDAIARGELAVEEGVLLVEEAELALNDIVRSAEQSGGVVRAIAQATGEQAQSIRFVAKEMERVAQTVSSVASTVREQARTSEQIAAATEQLSALTPKVQTSSAQQTAGSKRVRDAILRLSQMVERLGRVQSEQQSDGDRILRAIESLHENLGEQLKSIERLGGPHLS